MTTAEPSRQLRGVIFDMDGVLVLSEPLIAEAAIRMFAAKGYAVRHEEFRPFIGMGEDRFLGGVAEARGIPLDPAADKARTYDLYLDLIRGKLRPLPGVTGFVAECRRRGLKLAVASSADEVKVVANLHEIGLRAEACLVVEDAVAGVAAARAAGARCLAVTTSFPADQLGLAVWVASGLDQAPPQALAW